MPWIGFYANDDDIILINNILDDDPEIAFLVKKLKRDFLKTKWTQWIAVNSIEVLNQGQYTLWHIPSGPIPLPLSTLGDDYEFIDDPWQGWVEKISGLNSNIPWFFGDPPGIIYLRIQHKGRESDNSIGLSDFNWIGNRYSTIGWPAAKETQAWWRKLQKRIKDISVKKIPRIGPINGEKPEIWALPSAYKQIEEGRPRDANAI